MNIGIVTTWFDRGAAFVSKQIKDVLEAEHNVFVYARGGERSGKGNPNWDVEGVHWGPQLFWVGSGKIDKKDFIDWIHNNNIEVLIFNEQRWWQPIIWAKELGLKVGTYVDYYTAECVHNFKSYDFLICNTERHYSVFKSHPGAYFVKWGTDVQLFSPQSSDNESDSDSIVFFHSAGMDPYRKGTDLLISAFNKIKHKYSMQLIIHSQVALDVGEDGDGIKVINKTIKPPGLFHLGDVYVYPSRLDGLGLTVCEALACGLPVITTNSQPMSEFIVDGVNGYLVSVEKGFNRSDGYFWPMSEVSVDDLASKMLLFCGDSLRLGLMKNQARKYALDERDWNKNALEILRIIQDAPNGVLDADVRKTLCRFDYHGLKGKIDYALFVPLLRDLIQYVVKKYRFLKAPHLYN